MTRHRSPEPQWGLLHPGPSPGSSPELHDGGGEQMKFRALVMSVKVLAVLAIGSGILQSALTMKPGWKPGW